MSSLRRGHANLLCIVPILTDDLRRGSKHVRSCSVCARHYCALGQYWPSRRRSKRCVLPGEMNHQERTKRAEMAENSASKSHRAAKPSPITPREGRHPVLSVACAQMCEGWAEARVKITRMTLTIKLDRNWSSFQLANSAPPLSVTGSAIAPSARMQKLWRSNPSKSTC